MENAPTIDSAMLPASGMELGNFLQIPAVRQFILLIGIAASVAGGFAIVLWSQAPGMTQLYSDLQERDAGQVVEALRAAGIEYKLNTATGAIMVEQERLHDARLELAKQGLPEGGTQGMDMLQDQSSFGVSQFMETARYQHALEAELARTITHLQSVREARVHLALPKQSSFIRARQEPSASVLLHLQRGRELESDQAQSIVHLIASSVPNLVASNITLIDQYGRLLSSGDEERADAMTASQFKHTRRLENSYKRRIEDLLTPLLGRGRIRAAVVADLDFTVIEETRESFDPTRSTLRSEQISQEQRRGEAQAGKGIPGALSNQPPETGGVGPGQAGLVEDSVPLNSSSSSTRNFEVDKTISRTRPGSGSIRRLSVAVLVDDTPEDTGDGATGGALNDRDVERLTSLVREAVGFDATRGDTVKVVNAAFRSAPEPEPEAELKLWEKPIVRDILKQALGALLVLVLSFGLVRPMLRGLLTSQKPAQSPLPAGAELLESNAPVQIAGGPAARLPSYDEKVAAAKNIAGNDAAKVANIVKKWVSAGE